VQCAVRGPAFCTCKTPSPFHVVAAQVESESKIEAKLKAFNQILVSSGEFQVVSTWVS
jgi:hypothetical protein